MEILEIAFLILAYTFLIVTIFLEAICYNRNLETIETIYFTGSLLLLILSLTIRHFFEPHYASDDTDVFTLIAMVLIGLTTPLNVFEERRHNISPIWKKALLGTSLLLIFLSIASQYLNGIGLIQYIVAIFLALSVVFSMILIRMTKPTIRLQHREKVERIIAICMLIFVPLSLWANYAAEMNGIRPKIGFTLPLVFIILAASKIWDDMQRLSLFRPENTIKDQNLKNYSLSKREKEVAQLLIKGKTYNDIAEELFISVPTVKTHVTNIYGKCQVKNRAELISVLTIY